MRDNNYGVKREREGMREDEKEGTERNGRICRSKEKRVRRGQKRALDMLPHLQQRGKGERSEPAMPMRGDEQGDDGRPGGGWTRASHEPTNPASPGPTTPRLVPTLAGCCQPTGLRQDLLVCLFDRRYCAQHCADDASSWRPRASQICLPKNPLKSRACHLLHDSSYYPAEAEAIKDRISTLVNCCLVRETRRQRSATIGNQRCLV
jgi:hypothetical protein